MDEREVLARADASYPRSRRRLGLAMYRRNGIRQFDAYRSYLPDPSLL